MKADHIGEILKRMIVEYSIGESSVGFNTIIVKLIMKRFHVQIVLKHGNVSFHIYVFAKLFVFYHHSHDITSKFSILFAPICISFLFN
jgi:hypothetical protein